MPPSREEINLGHKRLIHVLETTTVPQIKCDYKQIVSVSQLERYSYRRVLVNKMAYCAVGVADKEIPDDFETNDPGISARVMKYYHLTCNDIDHIYAWNDVRGWTFKEIAAQLRKQWSA